ncbi:uncharacterized protein [Palaemon carinicauda]|uniref:uncharacterized protein n=1 Tax=Palaemon carinicauda TaxID=392227 RepID=UPI0035B5913D
MPQCKVEKLDEGTSSRLFLVEKASGSWHPVIDLSALNRFVAKTAFKMEAGRMVLAAIRKGDFMQFLDIKKAHIQIPVHPSNWKFFRFKWGEEWAHKTGIRLLRYLDGWLLLSESREQLSEQRNELVAFFTELGVVFKWEKSQPSPTTRTVYLGMEICSVQARAFPTKERIGNLEDLVKPFVRGEPSSLKDWQRLVGHLVSLEKLVPKGRLMLRPAQRDLKEVQALAIQCPSAKLSSSQSIKEVLQWSLDPRNTRAWISLLEPSAEVLLFLDIYREG